MPTHEFGLDRSGVIYLIGIAVIEGRRWRRWGQLAKLGHRQSSGSNPCKLPFPACSCAAAPRAARSSTPPTCPPTPPTRDRVLLAVMGSPDQRQIDGLGGAHPLTSKVGIVSQRQHAGRRSRLPVRAAAARQGHRRHHAQLRQHACRRGAVRARDRAGQARPAIPPRCAC